MSERPDTAAAFESWEVYKPRFKATIGEITGLDLDGPTLIDNPLVMLIYADGYLAGKRAALGTAGTKPPGLLPEGPTAVAGTPKGGNT